jgi:hypothetical protein
MRRTVRARHLERWRELSQLAINEQDPEKLAKAIEELDKFLEENLIDPEGPDDLQGENDVRSRDKKEIPAQLRSRQGQ